MPERADALALRAYLESIGDSAVVVDDDDIIKCHVHTDNPGDALQNALQHGALTKIKIENMREQHADNQKAVRESMTGGFQYAPVDPSNAYGFVAVCAGDGVEQLFQDLGVTNVVKGGQTMNPSTDDILSAVHATPAKTVFVLPNNKNIIMAAEQAINLADREVRVLPTKTIPEGLSAMLVFDESINAEENQMNMTKAAEKVSTGQVTFAARDSEYDGHKIKEGDILAIENGKVTSVESDIVKAAVKITKNMVKKRKGEAGFITVIYGEDATEEQAAMVEMEIKEKIDPDIEVALVNAVLPHLLLHHLGGISICFIEQQRLPARQLFFAFSLKFCREILLCKAGRQRNSGFFAVQQRVIIDLLDCKPNGTGCCAVPETGTAPVRDKESVTMAKRKVILDVDTGSHDAIALIAAMANPEFEVLGIMAVNGNRAVSITTENSLRISELMGGTVPVFQGCAVPWTSCMLGYRRHYPMYSAPEEALYKNIHGTYIDQCPPATIQAQPKNAVSWLVDTLMEAEDGEITLIPLCLAHQHCPCRAHRAPDHPQDQGDRLHGRRLPGGQQDRSGRVQCLAGSLKLLRQFWTATFPLPLSPWMPPIPPM